jgi:hypothetical protein
MIPRSACVGCRDNFYNGPMGDNGRCWHAKSGKMQTRYRIYSHVRPTEPYAFHEMRVPSCYGERGAVFYNVLPNVVSLKNVVRSKRIDKESK